MQQISPPRLFSLLSDSGGRFIQIIIQFRGSLVPVYDVYIGRRYRTSWISRRVVTAVFHHSPHSSLLNNSYKAQLIQLTKSS